MSNIADMLKQYANAIIAIVVLVLICAVVIERWHHGEQRYEDGKKEIQAVFNKYKQDEQDAKDKHDKQQEIDNAQIQANFQIAIANAKTQAGRAAIAEYLAHAGLLPAGGSVCSQQSGGDSQAQGHQTDDGATGERGTGESSSGLTEFATTCLNDAAKVMEFQDKAIREGWTVE